MMKNSPVLLQVPVGQNDKKSYNTEKICACSAGNGRNNCVFVIELYFKNVSFPVGQ